ncbi:MAG: hypothetical protein ABR881_16295 [Candidatus Sulfotelmatobacter sp.]
MGVTPEELSQTYPRLYHMADAQSWESIQKHGLLSTSSLLDLFGVEGREREDIESRRRPESVPIVHEKYGRAVVRDNKPIIESKLRTALKNCTLEQWYRLLNKFVFFWLTPERLQTLLCARGYRDHPHAVLTVETLPFVRKYEQRIVLSPMNSGNTQPIAHERSPETFKKMRDYPFQERAHRDHYYQVVELAVEAGADVTESVLSVDLMHCTGDGVKVLRNIYRR